MKSHVILLVLACMLAYTVPSLAVELELIPGGFPADQKPVFSKERSILLAEKRSLDGKVARYNKQCAKPKPYQTHKCSTDRLALFKMVDAYKNKVADFNKRLAVIDKGGDKQNNSNDKQGQVKE